MAAELPPEMQATVLRLQPGDVLVVNLPEDSTADQLREATEAFRIAIRMAGHKNIATVVSAFPTQLHIVRVEDLSAYTAAAPPQPAGPAS